jgi:Ser/Thr protein kinase RdoA (MazF antagonist)
LSGGDVTDGLVRVGATVRRPRQPFSDSVAAYLRHLEAVGFDGAPRWRGVDERDRDILDFIPGEVPGSPVGTWASTDGVLDEVAALLRALHDASAGFTPPHPAHWFGDDLDVELPAEAEVDEQVELITHSDVTPQNVVFAKGRPVALIDFDMTRPNSRVGDVLNTAMHWVPLKDRVDRDPAYADADVPARLRSFVDSYGLNEADRRRLPDLAERVFRRTWYRMRANAERRGGGWARMWEEGVGDQILRRQAWLAAERASLDDALQ